MSRMYERIQNNFPPVSCRLRLQKYGGFKVFVEVSKDDLMRFSKGNKNICSFLQFKCCLTFNLNKLL